MKKLFSLFTVLVFVCAVSVPALAAQIDIPLHIAGNTYYDTVEKSFLYYVNASASQAVRSNIADGMITEQTVSISSDAGVALEVYLNGERLQSISGGTFQTSGEYVVMYVGGTVPERLFSFTIVPKLCNSVTGYVLPNGFEFTEATLNGEPISFENNYIKFSEEGNYDIHYRCIKTNVSYQLLLTTDFTGPVLSLDNVKEGKEGRIVAKMNSLCDPKIMLALYEASSAGVKIDLIVRGICCLKAGVKGVSENITVRSIVGNFLEHSRIFYFYNDGSEDVYMGSADWMPRNLDKRVEILFPVENQELKEKVIHILFTQLNDTVKAHIMQPDGSYTKVSRRGKPYMDSQSYFCQEAMKKEKSKESIDKRVFEPIMGEED